MDVELPRKIVSVGTSLAGFAENVVGSGVKNHKWADNIMAIVKPSAGDNGLGVRKS